MKKIAIALLITAFVIVFVVGCSPNSSDNSNQNKASGKVFVGAGNKATSSSVKSEADSSNTSKNSSKSKSSSTSNPSNNVMRKLKYDKKSLPKEFENAVDNSFIVVVAFYDTTDAVSNKVQNEVEEVVEAPDYADKIKYFSYEVKENTASAVGRLTSSLGIKYMPSVSIIDGDKNIVFEDSGFTETSYFEHALYNTIFKDKSPANK